MIACAGDEIFADPSSIVGSIGVVSAGFGFDRLIERFGIERRVHTAGENKAMLDPFRPEDPKDVERLKALQRRIHEMFVDLVREPPGRALQGGRTASSSPARSGSARKPLGLGLVDGLGDMRTVLRERFGDKVQIRSSSPSRGALLARLLGRQPFSQRASSIRPKSSGRSKSAAPGRGSGCSSPAARHCGERMAPHAPSPLRGGARVGARRSLRSWRALTPTSNSSRRGRERLRPP